MQECRNFGSSIARLYHRLANKAVSRLHQSRRSTFPSECLGLHCARYRYFPESSLNDTAAKLGGRRYSLAVIAPRRNIVQNSGVMDARMTGHERKIAELITLGKSGHQTRQQNF